ncbi:MAG: NAD-glutamate dehydrogenase [Gammaproteobacteria bacterium]|nr:NAD-glutamate dehydrogenase [Gammaproteobacteria bacterium]
MNEQRLRHSRDLIEQIANCTSEELQVDGAKTFLRDYFANVPPEDLEDRDPRNLHGAALDHLRFASQRLPGQTLVRVINPRAETNGWDCSRTVVQVVVDDMPFLVDSVALELVNQGLTLHLTIHPVAHAVRDDNGQLTAILETGHEQTGVISESFIHCEIDQKTDAEELEAIKAGLSKVLNDVAASVADWHQMRDKIDTVQAALDEFPPPAYPDEIEEIKAFLDWLANDNFTFLGFREYDLIHETDELTLRVVPGSGLGILRDASKTGISTSFSILPPAVRKYAREPEAVILTKGNARSTVHRPGYVDYIGIKRFNRKGDVVGEFRFLGLYASVAYRCDAYEIPIVRHKLREVVRRSGFTSNSHAGKALQTILQTYPRTELFQISTDLLYDIAIGILQLQERNRVRIFNRPDKYGRFVSCLVFVPRDRYNTELRRQLEELLRTAYHGQSTEFNVVLGDSTLARIHMIVRTDPSEQVSPDVAELETRLTEISKTWAESLYGTLAELGGDAQANRLQKIYERAFPAGYREDFNTAVAAADIGLLEQLKAPSDLGLSLYRVDTDDAQTIQLKVARCEQPIPLSDALPILENMGLRVIAERPYRIRPAGRKMIWMHDFKMQHAGAGALDPELVTDRFKDAFVQVWEGHTDNDGFNRLVLSAGLNWRQARLLRACCRYLLQLGVPFSQAYMETTLASNSAITALWVEYFEQRFDPASRADRESVLAGLEAQLEESINAVTSLDEDRILRLYVSVARATLRTNYFQNRGSNCLVFKLKPRDIAAAPQPRPEFEIFVFSSRVEGVHLRGGKVARGGIRWSDRLEDYRTEILGLMKTQMVKNAVIVPVGAKGGFIAKKLPSDGVRDALRQEVESCYRLFIQALLDVTDNLADGATVHPEDMIHYDDDDPYLVVAADKGTATFSDIANEIATANGFWLDDAFASGGSTGYDHKAMGITARGAWESVKRHFRELGSDIQTTPFTVVGIGDMAGDVFGNGMLLSRQIRLIAAFNHLHIFVDPNPDPERTYVERERLFALPRSTWLDYDSTLISAGGGIFPRSAKSIPLSPEIREALDIETTQLTPNELILAILRAPVDLLWNGGIGTFVKSRHETHADAGDRVNDPIRVDASTLRARVFGEGGNLGLTQLGRIEYAQHGGLINTDSIDNSGGVDCSDHEVNIKILLNAPLRNHELAMDARNRLLVDMTENVADLVLEDNYQQTQAITQIQQRATRRLEGHARLIRSFEQSGRLDRQLEFLPNDEEINERLQEGRGLTRPEIAILLSYAKIDLYQALLESDVPEDSYFSKDLELYFPAALTEGFRAHMDTHPLRRQIIATYITNNMLNSVDLTLVRRFMDQHNYRAADIARAYTAARDAFDITRYIKRVEALDNQVGTAIQTEMLLDAADLMERATFWLLQHASQPLDIASTVVRIAPGIQAIGAKLPELVVVDHRGVLESAVGGLVESGVPADLALESASMGAFYSSLDIVNVAHTVQQSVEATARLYFLLGDRLQFYWLRKELFALTDHRYWQRMARDGLYMDSYRHQHDLTAAVASAGCEDPESAIQRWIDGNHGGVQRVTRILSELRESGSQDLAKLTVAARAMKNFVEHGS